MMEEIVKKKKNIAQAIRTKESVYGTFLLKEVRRWMD
jgi:hypothetical protein